MGESEYHEHGVTWSRLSSLTEEKSIEKGHLPSTVTKREEQGSFGNHQVFVGGKISLALDGLGEYFGVLVSRTVTCKI